MKYLLWNLRGNFLVSLLFLSACSSEPTQSQTDKAMDQSEQMSASEYQKVLDKYSAGDTEYNGFYHSFGFHAAILNSEVIEANIVRQTHYYMWDKSRSDSEKDKLYKSAAESTNIVLSFYTPEKKDDNLASDKSIWRLLLDAGGKRYVGKVKKLKGNLSEQVTLYPFHTRWNTLYLVSFPIPVSQIESQSSKFTITGPMGSRSVDFSAKN